MGKAQQAALPVWAWMCAVAALLWPLTARAATQVAYATVSDEHQLRSALASPDVTRVEVVRSFSLTEHAWRGMPLPVSRNVTIQGASGAQRPTVGLGYVRDGIRLAPGVVLTFRHLWLEDVRNELQTSLPGESLRKRMSC